MKHQVSCPLLKVAEKREVDIVKLLIQNGVNVNSVSSGGRRPLHGAIFTQRCTDCIEIVKMLVKNGADVDALDNSGRSPLHIAAEMGNAIIARFLIEHGCKVSIMSKIQGEALHLAAQAKFGDEGGYIELIKLLISRGADVNRSTKWGFSPLLNACHGDANFEVCNELILSGADVNASTCRGRTPLHCVAYSGKTDIMSLLIENGANVNAVDKYNITPLMTVSERSGKRVHVDALDMLLKNGARVNMIDTDKRSALDRASLMNDDPEVNRWQCLLQLLCHGAVIGKVALKNDKSGFLSNVKKCMEIRKRGGESMPIDLRGANLNAEEKHFLYCVATFLAMRCPGIARSVYGLVHSFITFHGIFMARDFKLGIKNAWDLTSNENIQVACLFDASW